MRAQKDLEFADFLLCIGDGTKEVNDEGEVLLPESLCIPYTSDGKDLDFFMIDWVFPKLDEIKPTQTTSPHGQFFLQRMIVLIELT
jgi:ATP-dependent DNA helicase PIF1